MAANLAETELSKQSLQAPRLPNGETGALDTSVVDPASLPFETVMAELEGIVRNMENGSLTLEQSLLAYRRGAALVVAGRRHLADVEQQVRILESEVLRPFEGFEQDAERDPAAGESGSSESTPASRAGRV